jgi:hypothetical protein
VQLQRTLAWAVVMSVSYSWRGRFSNEALNGLHAEAFGHQKANNDWWVQVNRHSLGWVCAKRDEALVGFVNVVTFPYSFDGGIGSLIESMFRLN